MAQILCARWWIDGLDNDCDGTVDAGVLDAPTWYRDGDGDGHGGITPTRTSCTQPPNYSSSNGDCDDGSDQVYPGAPEQCNGIDDDCNGLVDDNAQDRPFYRDSDQDGQGSNADVVIDCKVPDGYVVNSDDCDDTNPQVYLGAPESCDAMDSDCDGDLNDPAASADGADLYFYDADQDGYGGEESYTSLCEAKDGYVLACG